MIDDRRAAPLAGARLSGWVPDVLAALLAVGVLLVVSTHVDKLPGRPLDALGDTLLVLAGLAMGLCRRLPVVAASVVTVVLCVFLAGRYPDGPVWATAWIALAALSWRTSRRVAFTGAAVMLVILSVAAVAFGSDGLKLPAIFVGWVVATCLTGGQRRRATRSRSSSGPAATCSTSWRPC